MFTGIISDIGAVAARDGGRFTIRCGYPAAGIALGASIACDGACLTATAIEPAGAGSTFTVDVSNETLSKTTLGEWQLGRRINLERALKAGDELGGHMVSGHVDGVARVVSIRPDGESQRFTIEAPAGPRPLHRPQGLGGTRWHLAHRKRGRWSPLRRQHHPSHLDPHHLRGQKAGRAH